jgi:hypothetical protein
MAKKRNLFDELMTGVAAIAAEREGKDHAAYLQA